MHGKSSSSSVVCIPKEVRTDLWLSKTSDAETSVSLYVGFQEVNEVQVPLSGCLHSISCRQRYSC